MEWSEVVLKEKDRGHPRPLSCQPYCDWNWKRTLIPNPRNRPQGPFHWMELPDLPTGLDPVDLVTGGMRPGELWVVGGESSAGKSVALLQATSWALAAGKHVIVISLEMDAGVVIARLASCGRGIPYRRTRHCGSSATSAFPHRCC